MQLFLKKKRNKNQIKSLQVIRQTDQFSHSHEFNAKSMPIIVLQPKNSARFQLWIHLSISVSFEIQCLYRLIATTKYHSHTPVCIAFSTRRVSWLITYYHFHSHFWPKIDILTQIIMKYTNKKITASRIKKKIGWNILRKSTHRLTICEHRVSYARHHLSHCNWNFARNVRSQFRFYYRFYWLIVVCAIFETMPTFNQFDILVSVWTKNIILYVFERLKWNDIYELAHCQSSDATVRDLW